MEGVTTLPMRLWFALASKPTTIGTPFLRVTPSFPNDELPWHFAPELSHLASCIPYRLVPQLMAVEAEDFLRTTRLFEDPTECIELNCGCPSPTCVGKGAGSSLLKDPDDFHNMIQRIASELGKQRFAVKMRTAYEDAREFPFLLQGLREMPLARLTVHGRTRVDAYHGFARWDLIGAAADACDMPVIASGDIVDRVSLYDRVAAAPNICGSIIGRGALRNPWIFEELRSGIALEMSYETLEKSLVCHVLLHEMFAIDMAKFRNDKYADAKEFKIIKLVEEGLISEYCGINADAWQRVLNRLATEVPLPVSRVTMGRLKLIWNYLRSSLPEEFASTDLLRANELDTFVTQLRRCYESYSVKFGSSHDILLPLRHNQNWDWLYSGERRNRLTAP